MTVAPPELTPEGLLASAQTNLLAANLDIAKLQASQAIALAEALDHQQLYARATTMFARILSSRDETPEAMACALKAIELCRAADDKPSLARAHEVAARILLRVGETAAALAAGLAALEAAEASKDLDAFKIAMSALTNVYAELGQWDKALEFGTRYCDTARALGDKAAESAAIGTIAYIYMGMGTEAEDRGDAAAVRTYAEEAAARSRAAMELAREAGSALAEATCLSNLAESLSILGLHQEAIELLESRPLDPARDSPSTIAHYRETQGIVLVGLGRYDEAAELLIKSVAEAPNKLHEITACRALASLLEKIGDTRGALEHQKRLFALVSELSSEKAKCAASVTAVRLETAQAEARAAQFQAQAATLKHSNEQLNRRSEDLHRQAYEDPLTGLPNRRRLDDLLTVDLRDFTVVLLDVDRFKLVNDDHSHLVGDAVLCELAKLLRATCREGDTALRFGGEEFALLLVGASAEGAMIAAERARASVQAHNWGKLSPGLRVTVSLGVALGSEADNSTSLLELADRRLYAAKGLGRNRAVGPG